MHLILLGLTVAVTTAACSSITSTARGITVHLQASPPVAQLGDTVTFTVNVSANDVSGVAIDYGDANGDQSSTGGVPTVLVTFKHAYRSTGNFMARAAVSDAVIGVRQVTQQIVVIPRTDSTQTDRR